MEQYSISKTGESRIGDLNSQLLVALSNIEGKNGSVAGILQNLLNIGKDAAYRRLRGKVPFSVDEVALICNEFGICLDTLIYGLETGRAIFDLEEITPTKEEYGAFMQVLKAHTKIWMSKGKKLIAACPSIPEFIILRFPKFSQFRLFAAYADLDIPYSDFAVSKQFKDMQLAYNMAFAGIQSLELIFDENPLFPFIKEIEYFEKLGILSKKEVDDLYSELLLIVDVLEASALSGNLPGTKNTTDIYLSHTTIGTEIWLFENNINGNTAWLSSYPGKNIRTQNKQVCKSHKARINEIKRFSTYITRSGEMARRDFFNKLRNELKTGR